MDHTGKAQEGAAITMPLASSMPHGEETIAPIVSAHSERNLGYIAVLAVLVGIVGRLAMFAGQPLWFDETFTAVIATQPDIAHFYRWTVMELGGPAYYGVAWLWQLVAGSSNDALRLPSLLFSIATLVVAWRTTALSRPTRLILVSLFSLYFTSYLYAAEARSYALLILVGLAQSLAFITVLRETTLRNATVWVGLSCLAILTHYHAGVVSLVQGLIFLGVRRKSALQTWPAIFALAPALIWFWIQFSFLASYAKPGANWYSLIEPGAALKAISLAVPFGTFAYVLCAMAICPLVLQASRRSRTPNQAASGPRADAASLATAASGIGAVMLIVGAGMVVPSFAPRYLLPAMPSLFIGIACGLSALHAMRPIIVKGTLAILAVMSGSFCLQLARLETPLHPLNFEPASDWIMANGNPDRVIFFWDNPTSNLGADNHLQEVGGFFFARAGRPVKIVVPNMPSTIEDPNQALRDLAGRDGKGAILWLVDKGVPGTRAIVHDETLTSDQAWSCKKSGSENLYILACLPRH